MRQGASTGDGPYCVTCLEQPRRPICCKWRVTTQVPGPEDNTGSVLESAQQISLHVG